MGFLTKWFGAAIAPQKVRRVSLPANAIRPNDISLLQQRGWRRRGNQYTGPFATPFGTWHGRVEAAGDILRCYIKDPPVSVVSGHHKWPCFSRDGPDGWFRIHLTVSPCDRDVSAVILYVERVMIESYRRAGKR